MVIAARIRPWALRAAGLLVAVAALILAAHPSPAQAGPLDPFKGIPIIGDVIEGAEEVGKQLGEAAGDAAKWACDMATGAVTLGTADCDDAIEGTKAAARQLCDDTAGLATLGRADCDDAIRVGREAMDRAGDRLKSLCDSAIDAASAGGLDCDDLIDAGKVALDALQDPVGAMAKGLGLVFEKIFESMVTSALEGMAGILTQALTFWLKLPGELGDTQGLANKVQGHLGELQIYLLGASITFAAVRLALAWRQGKQDIDRDLFMLLFRTVFASTTLAGVIVLAHRVGDAFSAWVIDSASGGNPGEAMKKIVVINPGGFLFVWFLVAILGIIGGLIQIVALVIRAALLAFAVGFIPIAAASSGFDAGAGAYKKLMSFTLAALLFKPIGALLYAMAFWAAGDGDDFGQQLLGVVMVVMVAAVLPSVVKLVAPAAAGAGTGGSALAAVGGAAAVGAMLAGGAAAGGAAAGAAGGGGAGSAGAGGGATGGGAPPPPPPSGGPSSPPSGPSGAGSGASGPSGADSGASSGGSGAGASAGLAVMDRGADSLSQMVDNDPDMGSAGVAR